MQLDFFDVPSPCVGVCQSDDKGHCRGCMRSRDERQNWKEFTNDEKQKVIKRCVQRTRRKQKQLKVKVVEPVEDLFNAESVQPSLLEPRSNKPAPSNDLDFSEFEL